MPATSRRRIASCSPLAHALSTSLSSSPSSAGSVTSEDDEYLDVEGSPIYIRKTALSHLMESKSNRLMGWTEADDMTIYRFLQWRRLGPKVSKAHITALPGLLGGMAGFGLQEDERIFDKVFSHVNYLIKDGGKKRPSVHSILVLAGDEKYLWPDYTEFWQHPSWNGMLGLPEGQIMSFGNINPTPRPVHEFPHGVRHEETTMKDKLSPQLLPADCPAMDDLAAGLARVSFSPKRFGNHTHPGTSLPGDLQTAFSSTETASFPSTSYDMTTSGALPAPEYRLPHLPEPAVRQRSSNRNQPKLPARPASGGHEQLELTQQSGYFTNISDHGSGPPQDPYHGQIQQQISGVREQVHVHALTPFEDPVLASQQNKQSLHQDLASAQGAIPYASVPLDGQAHTSSAVYSRRETSTYERPDLPYQRSHKHIPGSRPMLQEDYYHPDRQSVAAVGYAGPINAASTTYLGHANYQERDRLAQNHLNDVLNPASPASDYLRQYSQPVLGSPRRELYYGLATEHDPAVSAHSPTALNVQRYGGQRTLHSSGQVVGASARVDPSAYQYNYPLHDETDQCHHHQYQQDSRLSRIAFTDSPRSSAGGPHLNRDVFAPFQLSSRAADATVNQYREVQQLVSATGQPIPVQMAGPSARYGFSHSKHGHQATVASQSMIDPPHDQLPYSDTARISVLSPDKPSIDSPNRVPILTR